ncbi:MAG: hypothetical protein HY913_15040 [Desulfomonile tiedjei]|nr:hypothetical protein [Desulfomonile tiedjei]
MRVRHTIKANEFISDIRSGATDFQLIEKYNLSLRGLDTVLGHLVDFGLITQTELEERQQFTDSMIIRAFLESRREIKVLV